VPGQGYLGVLRDVTEEVERIAELREANARLERQAAELAAAAASLDAMRRRAEEACAAAELANRAKSSFLANMSHELRTPLNAINGFSEIIADLRFGPDAIAQYRDYARDIHKSGEHLLGLINTVLDLAKVEAGRMELREETVELAPCLLAALRMIRPAAAAKPLRLSYVPPRAPLRLRADEQKLKQSVLNVLSNAVKFTPAGGAVILSVERRPQEVAILVADTGIGIRAEDQDKVFAPFAQVDSALTRRTEGTGLGMALTRSLIELHGGRVTLDSAVGRGTTVALCLPVDRFEPAPLRAVG
jgi:two-component system cell cycle sensor histidine kinase PleC